MDDSRFDSLARALAQPGSRRRLIGGLVAGVLGLAGTRPADARTCSGVGTVCREHAICCSGLCGEKDQTQRRRCACQVGADCPVPGSACQGGTCVGPTTTPRPTTTTTSTTGTTTTTTSTTTTTLPPCLPVDECCADEASCREECCSGVGANGTCGGFEGEDVFVCVVSGCGGRCRGDNDCLPDSFCDGGTCTCRSGFCFDTDFGPAECTWEGS